MFLWNGAKEEHTFAWTKWARIPLPKIWDGWGIKDLHSFAKALATNLGWQILIEHNLWTGVVTQKYIYPLFPLDWIINVPRHRSNISTI